MVSHNVLITHALLHLSSDRASSREFILTHKVGYYSCHSFGIPSSTYHTIISYEHTSVVDFILPIRKNRVNVLDYS